jgi:DNA-binding GntR family transcriptional regulator
MKASDDLRAASANALGASDGSSLGPIANPRLVDIAMASLRQAIIVGELAPGQRLVESSLAAKLKISRGPLREALQFLEQEGLVVTLPRRGRFVQSLDIRTLEEVYSLRRVLEPFAAARALASWSEESYARMKGALDRLAEASRSASMRLVAERDIEFHTTLIELADHQLLWRTWNDSVAGNLHLLLNLTTPTHDSLDEPVRRHAVILDGLVAGDVTPLRREIEGHIDDALARSRRSFPAIGPAQASA